MIDPHVPLPFRGSNCILLKMPTPVSGYVVKFKSGWDEGIRHGGEPGIGSRQSRWRQGLFPHRSATRGGGTPAIGPASPRGSGPPWVRALATMNAEIDIRHILPAIRVPTLILHSVHDGISLCLVALLDAM
jgi:hypothetical protein